MYRDMTVAVVVPAYNEEKLIGRVIETMPDFVDRIVVVDDKSRDGTVNVVKNYQASSDTDRITLIQHERNQGVGGAIATGYKWARDNSMDIAVVMDGDGQMDPNDMPDLLDPIVEGDADYTKGNRLFTGDAWKKIPKVRYLGNSVLSLLTKIASGYWHVADSQSGYRAANLRVLQTLDWNSIYKRYGVPNDMLVKLNIYNFRVIDVPITPVYNVGEKSGIRLYKVIPRISWLLLKRFFWRMKEKYIIRDFHPLIFFYALGILLVFLSVPLAVRVFYYWGVHGRIPPINALAMFFSFVAGMQSLFFAMWFDMEYNRHLK
ncbi:glycosyltransferase family 2 protein [Candidatus Poribacteria bacterium]